MSQFKFGDRVKVDGVDDVALVVRPKHGKGDMVSVIWPRNTFTYSFEKWKVTLASESATDNDILQDVPPPATATTPSDEIDTKIISIINQLRQSMRHWLGAMLDISVPQHGLSETSRIYHIANELEQRLNDYRDLLTANIASRQEDAACGS